MELQLENLCKGVRRKHGGGRGHCCVGTRHLWLAGSQRGGKNNPFADDLRCLEATAGQVRLDGIPIDALGASYRDKLGYLPQDFVGYPQYSARDFLLYMAVLKGMTRSQAMPKIQELLHMVRLQEAGNKKIQTLSGGMRRRLGIAQALLNDPDILILDEPTAGLGPQRAGPLPQHSGRVCAEKNCAAFTHIVSDLEAIAHKVFLMKDGRFQTQGTVSELLQQANGACGS